jgi:hypothetical protein
MGDPQFGRANQQYRIIKNDDPNFGVLTGGGQEVRTGYAITADVVPPQGMPSGPGFDKGDIAGGLRKKKTKTRTFPRGILRKTNKVVPSKNPSKPPPTRITILSKKNLEKTRKNLKMLAGRTDIKTIRKRLEEKNLIKAGSKAPPATIKKLFETAVGAGLLNC